MILNEDDLLEHSGVKGMKWGQRRARDKAKLIGAGGLGYNLASVGVRGVNKLSNKIGDRDAIGPLTEMGLGITAAAAAVNVTRNILNAQGNVKVPRKQMRSAKKAAKKDAKAAAKATYLNN